MEEDYALSVALDFLCHHAEDVDDNNETKVSQLVRKKYGRGVGNGR